MDNRLSVGSSQSFLACYIGLYLLFSVLLEGVVLVPDAVVWFRQIHASIVDFARRHVSVYPIVSNSAALFHMRLAKRRHELSAGQPQAPVCCSAPSEIDSVLGN